MPGDWAALSQLTELAGHFPIMITVRELREWAPTAGEVKFWKSNRERRRDIRRRVRLGSGA
jgi:hypothetical protein